MTSDDTNGAAVGLRPDIAAAVERIPRKGRGDGAASPQIPRLADMLWPDETVELIAPGRSRGVRGLLVATDRRLFFTPDGGRGQHTTDFPYPAIDSIRWQPGLLSGAVTIAAREANFDMQYLDKTLGQVLVAQTLPRIGTPEPADAPRAPGDEPLSAGATIDQLSWLVQMHQTGVLSDAEFAAAKARLLKD